MHRLYDYRLELLKTNPDSTIKIRCDQGVFEAMYVCPSPLEMGFVRMQENYLHRWLFLKRLIWGQLLTVVGIDASNYI